MAHINMKTFIEWNVQVGNIVYGWWYSYTLFGLIVSCTILALIAILNQALRSWHSFREVNDSLRLLPTFEPVNQVSSYSNRLVWQTMHTRSLFTSFLVGLQAYITAILMLAMMSFNGFIIISIVGGHAAGHYIFGGPVEQCH